MNLQGPYAASLRLHAKRPGSESSTLRERARDDPLWVADSGREQLCLLWRRR
jgi:hypothetical protein